MHCCQKNNISLLLYGRAEQWAAAGAWEDKVHDYSFQTVSACLSVINCDSLGNFWRCTSGQAAPLGWNLYRQTPLLFSFAASHWKQTWKLIRVLISRGFNMKLRRAAPIIMTEKATRLGSFFPLFLFFSKSAVAIHAGTSVWETLIYLIINIGQRPFYTSQSLRNECVNQARCSIYLPVNELSVCHPHAGRQAGRQAQAHSVWSGAHKNADRFEATARLCATFSD